MQIIDKIFPAYLTRWIHNGRHFLYFEIKDTIFLYDPILGSNSSVFYPRNHGVGIYAHPRME